ncbi:MAG: putative metal-binding motif-containing protein [Candidatus Woesearchaeota archaeon]|nr:putative metal-binding motif-containing protein [Candidatus Woesearchaeota archaeon]
MKASKYCSAGIPCCGHYNISNTCFYGSSCNSNTCSFSSCTMNPDQNCADQGCTGGCTSPVTLPNCTAYCPCGLGCNCPIGCNKENVLVNNNCNGDKCITRRNWTNEISGCCLEESQCLVDPDGSLEQIGNVSAYFSDNKPRCINSGQFILDHYCNNGEWTTRTALIAGELLNFTYADAGRSSDFTLFCDDYTYALNYYEYLPVINYLSQPCSLNNVEIPCLNDICVLRYKDGSSYKVIAATALNWNISNSTPFSFLNAIGRSASYCNAVSGSDYAACSNGKDVWYNPIINAVVFSNTGFSLNPSFIDSLITILRNPFGTLINWINQRNMADQQWPIANFKKLYISSNAGKKVSAFISNNSQASNLFMHFQSFSTDLCSEAETFVPGSCTKATKCDQMINSSVAKGETNKLFDSWAEMTAQLRINASFSQNHCNNCIKDADELGIDCGGNDCPPCNCADFDSDRDEYLDNSYSGIDSCVLGDCNDNDASIHPGATEICDGIDNNCNNQIDEGCPSTLTMQILAPHIGEVIQAGASSYSIIWNLSSPMLTNSFDLEFTLNNGLLNYNNLAINIGKASACAGNTCTYSWSPVTSSKSSQAKIRITARNSTGAAVAAAESGIFTIGPLPQISLIITKPRAGDILNISAGNPINWSAAGPDIGQIQSYSLHYSTADNLGQSGDWSIIGYAQKGSLGYNWIIPNTFTPGQYYIMVKGLAADSSMLVYNISELISTSRWCSYYVGTCSVNPYAYGPSVCSRTQYNITIPLAQQCPSDSGCTQNSNCP